MEVSFGGARHVVLAEMNVVPLIDILLVLVIIFMMISPHVPVGLPTVVPEPEAGRPTRADVVVVQVLADGSLRINREAVPWADLQSRLEEIFRVRASRAAFVQGANSLEFGTVARAIDVMRGSGITSVGLMTPELENAQ